MQTCTAESPTMDALADLIVREFAASRQ